MKERKKEERKDYYFEYNQKNSDSIRKRRAKRYQNSKKNVKSNNKKVQKEISDKDQEQNNVQAEILEQEENSGEEFCQDETIKKDLKLNDDKDAQLDQETEVVAQAPWLPRIKHASHGQTRITAQRACLPKTMQPKNCSVQLALLRKSAPRCVCLFQRPRLLSRALSKQQRLGLQRCREILATKQRRVLNMV